MKKVFLSLFMLCALFAQAAEIERIEPACWWVDMKNPELQIMVYGKNIAHSEVSIDYPGVRLKREFDISTSLLNMSMSQPEHVLQHKEARKYR